MTPNASIGVRRAMWYSTMVLHLLQRCYAEEPLISVEDVIVNNINCTVFDCDETSFATKYNNDGIACVNVEIRSITPIHPQQIPVSVKVRQCFMDKCETSLGLDTDDILENVLTTENVMNPFFKAMNIKISEDCGCIYKGNYKTTNYCPVQNNMIERAPRGRYLVTFMMRNADNNVLIELDTYVELI